ncbi:MAG: hypothetical protein LBT45_01960 [Rickettsiales bacterium]|jgi:hypothetical protein|nr:hypothetical protein [Rickettsiales bacterium]
MFNTKRDAEVRLAQFLMDDLPLEACPAVPAPLPGDWFARFRAARMDFMGSLSESVQELALLNLSREDFMSLLSGQRIPENLTVKFRRPILYGGSIHPENMFLMPLFPAGFNLDIFMSEQFGQGQCFYPNPAKKVYVSVQMLSGGDGGNATADRLSQGFAAHANQGRE